MVEDKVHSRGRGPT